MTSDLYKQGDVIAGKYVVHQLLGKGGFGAFTSCISVRQARLSP